MARAGGGAVGPGLQESARGQEVARSSFRRAFPERLLCARLAGGGAPPGHKGCESGTSVSSFPRRGACPCGVGETEALELRRCNSQLLGDLWVCQSVGSRGGGGRPLCLKP